MELMQVWRVLRRWWWLILIPVVISAVLALPSLRSVPGGGFSTTISYSAFQNYDAIPRVDGDYQDIWLSSELTVNALTEWVMGSRFKDEIAALAPDVTSPRWEYAGTMRAASAH